MKIHALTVCVNYADWFEHSAERWMKGLASLTLVTSSRDEETPKLAERIGARLFVTDIFYKDGASFNKGRAMEQARRILPEWEDWFLFFDADIVPEADWYKKLCAAAPEPGKLYGAWRHQCNDLSRIDSLDWPKIPDALCDGGYFHLFHTSDARANGGDQQAPLLETCWSHAGVYDSVFKKRWPNELLAAVPIRLTHIGERENWTGRGDREGMKKLLQDRIRRGGGWQSVEQERIKEDGGN